MPEDTPTCRIHEKYGIKCFNPALPGAHDGFCILHSRDKGKDPHAFKAALQARWQQEDREYHDFLRVFFPGPFGPAEAFESREFKKPVAFSGATFTEEANFSQSKFGGWAYFFEAIFSGRADFSCLVTFTEEAIFSQATFMVPANFSGAIFQKKADFSGASFTEGAGFFVATFMETVSFARATFTEEANFCQVTFTERADFSHAIFEKGADFSHATFKNGANFSGATFKGNTDFSIATFAEDADFSKAAIGDRLVFKNINSLEEEGSPPFSGNFSHLEFSDQGVLSFQDMSLALVQFVGTDLRRPEFHHVAWHRIRGGRQALYHEVLLREREPSFTKRILNFASLVSAPEEPVLNKDDYGEVERLYRNLQVNYESENDYKSSGDFHYGEMDIHRRSSKWRWFPFYWYNLYWALSGYGERPSQALGWLVGLLALLPLLIWLLGLDISPQSKAPGFWETFSYMFEKATLQKPESLSGINSLGRFISSLGLLIIPGQAALFLLALRNRLGRRR